MKRASLEVLGDDIFDVLVVGGGIYGLMAARDAALRGLRTALVERNDFGSATSHNSLKIMHGGIRYVQHLDLSRLRASARERAFWQRAAPHLVRPLEFTIPLFGHGVKGLEAFAAAALAYNAASAGLRGPHYPGARAVGRDEARRRLGDLAPEGMSGGGVWRDGQITDVNRVHMACLRASLEAGGVAANYMDATTLTAEGGRITGARLHDRLCGREGTVRARVTLSCAGAAAARLAAPHLGGANGFPDFARATNLIVDRRIGEFGLGAVSRARSDAMIDRGGRMYFLTPWAGRTIVGTHESAGADAAEVGPDVDHFLRELALACPSLALTRQDIVWVHQGLIPADVDDARHGVRRQTRGTLQDHSAEGLGGLVSVIGVKYTTARLLAERAVDRAAIQIDRPVPPSASFHQPLPATRAEDPDPRSSAAALARIREAVDGEMAVTLEDVALRRTGWAETGALADPADWERLAAAAGLDLGRKGCLRRTEEARPGEVPAPHPVQG